MARAHISPAATGPQGGFLECRALSSGYGRHIAIRDIDLAIPRGSFVSLLGPSGCGKTTLLRVIAGLARAQTGHLYLADEDITDLPAFRRNVGVVFQNYALFPHLDVLDNVAFGLVAKGMKRADAHRAALAMLRLVRLDHLADRSVATLSGGQQQRVAVARALAPKPRLILLDEPFSALDRQLRGELQVELRQLLADIGMTAIFVTHDQSEAFAMSDYIGVMRDGVLEQFDTPQTLYHRPATEFVLDFVGMALRIAGRVQAADTGKLEIETAYGTLNAPGHFVTNSLVTLAVRPQHVELRLGTEPGPGEVAAICDGKTYLGGELLCRFNSEPGDRLFAIVAEEVAARLDVGSPGLLRLPMERAIILPR